MFHSFIFVIALAGLLSYLNYRFIGLPSTIGLMILALVFSIVMSMVEWFDPSLFHKACQVVVDIDFQSVLMDIMLSLLLFAGAREIKLMDLEKEKLTVLSLATLGVVISTVLVGAMAFWSFQFFGLEIPFLYCLVFGALISPTDPVAVLAIVNQLGISRKLETKIAGESLFNDGIGVVVFVTALGLAQSDGQGVEVGEIVGLFLTEVIGGLGFGAVLGFLGYMILRSIHSSPKIQIMVSISIVMGGYSLATALHVSGPLAMVVTGLIIGNRSRDQIQSADLEPMEMFWGAMDEILNAILFVLIGLEILVIDFQPALVWMAFLAWLITVLSRFISVSASYEFVRRSLDLSVAKSIVVLSWGGLRGGISIALAMSLPNTPYSETLLFITYGTVLASILIQGLSMGSVVHKLQLSQ